MPHLTIDQALQQGLGHHQAGRLGEAEAIYRQILGVLPEHPGALHLLGLIGWQTANGSAAQLDEAERLIRQAIERWPSEGAYYGNLARLVAARGRKAEAVALQREALRLSPGPAHLYALGVALLEAGELEEAEQRFAEAIAGDERHVEALNALGAARLRRGAIEEAEISLRRALEIQPQHAEALGNLGDICQKRGHYEEAATYYRRAVAIKPGRIDLLRALGDCLAYLRLASEALQVYRRILEVEPQNVAVWNNLGGVLRGLDRFDEACEAFKRALAIDPQLALTSSNLAMVRDLQGEHAEATAHAREAVRLQPDDSRLHSNLLYLLHFDPAYDAQALFAEHREWNRRHALPLAGEMRPHLNVRDAGRRIRVGYVSPNFTNHAVGRFMIPVLEGHRMLEGEGRGTVEVICFSGVRPSDEDSATTRLRELAHGWHSIIRMPHEEVAALVRQCGIDILVDLAMHMDGSRLPVFARKPASVQVAYLAYCSTTGLDAIDYRLTDRWLDPADGFGERYSERSEYLESYWCYGESHDAGAVAALPAVGAGAVTFGCLNNFSKTSHEVLEVWAKILARVAGSRLLLHGRPGSHRERAWALLERCGVARSRVEFINQLPSKEYFALYNRIDVALDPFPYAGGTTTCDALWMGVPVVTLQPGPEALAVGRGGVSILNNAGMPEWIGEGIDVYVEKAVELAGDLEALARTRRSMRERLKQSRLMDARSFACSIEAAYRRMWQAWCAR